MRFYWIALFMNYVHSLSEEGLTTQPLRHVEGFDHVAEWGDAQHRGEKWYDLANTASEESDLKSGAVSSSSSVSLSSMPISESDDGSSVETKERKKVNQVFRTCTPCPQDMLKSYRNAGIKWICGGYQRARRSFKSHCMMRFRNCQDGTLFVKLYDHRCKNDSYHGKHWFYVYKT